MSQQIPQLAIPSSAALEAFTRRTSPAFYNAFGQRVRSSGIGSAASSAEMSQSFVPSTLSVLGQVLREEGKNYIEPSLFAELKVRIKEVAESYNDEIPIIRRLLPVEEKTLPERRLLRLARFLERKGVTEGEYKFINYELDRMTRQLQEALDQSVPQDTLNDLKDLSASLLMQAIPLGSAFPEEYKSALNAIIRAKRLSVQNYRLLEPIVNENVELVTLLQERLGVEPSAPLEGEARKSKSKKYAYRY